MSAHTVSGRSSKSMLTVGAIANVCPSKMCEFLGTEQTELSREGHYYFATDGTHVFNKCPRRMTATNVNGKSATMTFQVCDVKGPFWGQQCPLPASCRCAQELCMGA